MHALNVAQEAECLVEVLAEAGLEEDLVEKTQQLEVKDALINNGKEAVEAFRGVSLVRVRPTTV